MSAGIRASIACVVAATFLAPVCGGQAGDGPGALAAQDVSVMERREVWFGTDANTVGKAFLR